MSVQAKQSTERRTEFNPVRERSPFREAFHESGVIIIDKPKGITSMDVIREIRRIAYIKRLGHGGTLDPFATGVLPILVNDATRLSSRIMDSVKEYEGILFLGQAFDTQDMTGQPLHELRDLNPSLSLQEVQEISRSFVGEILQKPPAYSAIKRQGRPLYDYARAGESVEVEPRPVKVERFDIVERLSEREFSFSVRCAKGTYVRTLVHDLGEKLGVGAVTKELKRTLTGPFHVDGAVQLSTLRFISDIKSHLKAINDVTRMM